MIVPGVLVDSRRPCRRTPATRRTPLPRCATTNPCWRRRRKRREVGALIRPTARSRRRRKKENGVEVVEVVRWNVPSPVALRARGERNRMLGDQLRVGTDERVVSAGYPRPRLRSSQSRAKSNRAGSRSERRPSENSRLHAGWPRVAALRPQRRCRHHRGINARFTVHFLTRCPRQREREIFDPAVRQRGSCRHPRRRRRTGGRPCRGRSSASCARRQAAPFPTAALPVFDSNARKRQSIVAPMKRTPPAVAMLPPMFSVPVLPKPFSFSDSKNPNGTFHAISPRLTSTATSSPNGPARAPESSFRDSQNRPTAPPHGLRPHPRRHRAAAGRALHHLRDLADVHHVRKRRGRASGRTKSRSSCRRPTCSGMASSLDVRRRVRAPSGTVVLPEPLQNAAWSGVRL